MNNFDNFSALDNLAAIEFNDSGIVWLREDRIEQWLELVAQYVEHTTHVGGFLMLAVYAGLIFEGVRCELMEVATIEDVRALYAGELMAALRAR